MWGGRCGGVRVGGHVWGGRCGGVRVALGGALTKQQLWGPARFGRLGKGRWQQVPYINVRMYA